MSCVHYIEADIWRVYCSARALPLPVDCSGRTHLITRQNWMEDQSGVKSTYAIWILFSSPRDATHGRHVVQTFSHACNTVCQTIHLLRYKHVHPTSWLGRLDSGCTAFIFVELHWNSWAWKRQSSLFCCLVNECTLHKHCLIIICGWNSSRIDFRISNFNETYEPLCVVKHKSVLTGQKPQNTLLITILISVHKPHTSVWTDLISSWITQVLSESQTSVFKTDSKYPSRFNQSCCLKRHVCQWNLTLCWLVQLYYIYNIS